VVVATSVNRLVAARPHSAAHVEAPDPDIIMRRCATSERDHDPSDGIDRSTIDRSNARQPSCLSRARAVSATLTSSDGTSATVVLLENSKGKLDNKPQLKGRLTVRSKLVKSSESPTVRQAIAAAISNEDTLSTFAARRVAPHELGRFDVIGWREVWFREVQAASPVFCPDLSGR
jgi:hypothetical protein